MARGRGASAVELVGIVGARLRVMGGDWRNREGDGGIVPEFVGPELVRVLWKKKVFYIRAESARAALWPWDVKHVMRDGGDLDWWRSRAGSGIWVLEICW